MGGRLGPGGSPGAFTSKTELWNGSQWSETSDLNVTRQDLRSSSLSQTAALAFGGSLPAKTAVTEEWNANVAVGVWITGANLNTARRDLAGAGSSNTSVLAFGGSTPPSTDVGVTENYNGTSWAEVNDMNTSRNNLAGGGIATSAMVFGGFPPSSRSALA